MLTLFTFCEKYKLKQSLIHAFLGHRFVRLSNCPFFDASNGHPYPIKDEKGLLAYIEENYKSKQIGACFEISERELCVLKLLARGITDNKTIGEKLFIKNTTVSTHLCAIYQKLNTHDKTQALVMAIKQGLVTVERTG